MRLAVEMRFKVSMALGIPFKVFNFCRKSRWAIGKSAVMSVTRDVINVCRSAGNSGGRVIEAANDAFSEHESVGEET